MQTRGRRGESQRKDGRGRKAGSGGRGYERPDCLGVDGEGFDSGSVYSYMACSAKTHEIATAEDLRGLTTAACLDFLLELPCDAVKFGFSLGYDYTKILADLPDKSLWLLARPEERMPAVGPPSPVIYLALPRPDRGHGGGVYSLNMLGSRLSVQKMDGHRSSCENEMCYGCRPGPKAVLWDVF